MKKSIAFVLAFVLLLSLIPTAFASESKMKASNEIIALIKSLEGFSPTAYRGSGEEYLTIGYGHYGADVTEDMTLTEAEADALLRNDLVEYENYVNNFFTKHNLNYSQQVFDAVLSLTYNIGNKWMSDGNYRIKNYLVNGLSKYSDIEIADALGVICSAGGTIYPGLINRRIKEARIMLYGDYVGNASPDFVYLILNPNGGTLNDGNRVKIYAKGNIYGTLPSAYKDGCVLDSWKTSAGMTVKSTDIANQSLIVNAIWSNGAPKKYKLSVVGGRGSGTYAEGETVTIAPTDSSFLAWRSGDVKIITSGGKYSFKMPKNDLKITTVNNYNCAGKFCPAADFSDIGASHWAHQDIDFVYKNDLFKGYSDTVFNPTVTMSRGMLITVLYRLNGSPDITGYENPFSDVVSSSPYYSAILWGYHNRIANGFENGSFHPNDTLKREQLATFLLRYANYMGYRIDKYGDISGFADANTINDYADESISWAVGNKIINGTDAKTLSPQSGATRAQVAAMVTRFVKNIMAGAEIQELK